MECEVMHDYNGTHSYRYQLLIVIMRIIASLNDTRAFYHYFQSIFPCAISLNHLSIKSKVPLQPIRLMTSLLIIATTLLQGGWTAAVPTARQRAAFVSRMQRARGLPQDVLGQLVSYIPIDDWSRLNLVFKLDSPRLQPLQQIVTENRNEIRRSRSFERGMGLKVQTDENGNIVEIWATHMGLKDEDILDLSKLPPTLQALYLSDNHLTKVDLRSPPRNLEVLNLARNQLTEFNINNAPKTLTLIDLESNQLDHVDISSCKGIPQEKGMPLIVFLNQNPNDFQLISSPPIETGDWKADPYLDTWEVCSLKVPIGDPSNEILIYKTKCSV